MIEIKIKLVLVDFKLNYLLNIIRILIEEI